MILGIRPRLKTFLGSTHIAEQLLFSMVPSILTFNFDLIFWLFLVFWVLIVCFWGSGKVQNIFGSTSIAEQLLFSMLPSTLPFNFDQIWGPF